METTTTKQLQGINLYDKAAFAAKAITEWGCVVLLMHPEHSDRFVCRNTTKAEFVNVEYQPMNGEASTHNTERVSKFTSWLANAMFNGWRWANENC